jgi:hypothetical protein
MFLFTTGDSMYTQFGNIGTSGLSATDAVLMRASAFQNKRATNFPVKPVMGEIKTPDEYFRDKNTDVWGEPFFGSIGKDRYPHLRGRKPENTPKEKNQ